MKQKIFILPVLLWAFVVMLHAQAPVIKWQEASVSGPPILHQFIEDGYPAEYMEYIYHQLEEIVVGSDGSYAGIDIYRGLFVKFDAAGKLILVKSIVGMDGGVTSIKKASDGGYILLGRKYVYKTGGAISYPYLAIFKLDESGNKIWEKTFKGTTVPVVPRSRYRYDCEPGSITTTKDGGYLIGATSFADAGNDKSEHAKGESDYWIIKIDAAGTKQWDKTIGGSGYDGVSSFRKVMVAQTSDGNYIVGGTSLSSASGDKTEDSRTKPDARTYAGDYWVLKLSNSGSILWQKTLGGDATDQLAEITPTADGGCIIGGESNSAASGEKTQTSLYLDLWVIKLNTAGAVEWQKTIVNNNTESWENYLRSIFQEPGGGYIIGGNKSIQKSLGRGHNYWVLKLSETGNLDWQIALGGTVGGTDNLAGLIPLSNGHILAAGVSASEVSGNKTVTKIEPNGGNDYWLLELMPCQNGSDISKTICHGDTYDFNGTAVRMPGVYRHTLTNQYGCDSVVVMTLDFYPFGNPAVTVQENVLSSTATHNSYQWLLDGRPLNGETKASYTAVLNGSYQLVVTTADNCHDTSLVVKPLFKPNIFVPTLFSPNGDGKNDVLKVYGNQLLAARLLIFNQWGQKVFETNNAVQTGWDGTVGGKPQPMGVYMYVLETTLSNGNKETSRGSFTLVR
jgi:gliding motility-associated-like protein